MASSINITQLAGDSWNPSYHPIIQAIGWVVAFALSLETILGNAIVLLAYHLERSISKQLNNRFIVSLAVSDMIIGLEGIPLFTVYVINDDRWPLGAIACETWLFLDYTLCLVSILTVLLITADRYLSVCHTARYLKWQSPMKVQMLIFGSWILPALIFGVMIYGWPWIGAKEEEIQATSNGECYAPFLSNPFVNMGMYLAYYWTTLVAMLILYKGIHKAARKLEKRSRAREHRHIALLLTQRLGTQVGVGLMLHARKYHEEVMKTDKQQPQQKPASTEVKDSGYTTNNTLSTSESSDRRRSSFALLVKAVQSTQKLAQFRGRGATFAFRTTNCAGEEGETTLKRSRQLGVNGQQQHGHCLERLSEQNSGSQVGEAVQSGHSTVEEVPTSNSIEEMEEDEGNNSPWVVDDGIDDIDEFPTGIIRSRCRFDSDAVASLSTEHFHEESLSSVLCFNPSAMASPLLDPAQSDSSSELLANRNGLSNGNVIKRHCFSLSSHQWRNGGAVRPAKMTGSLKERVLVRPQTEDSPLLDLGDDHLNMENNITLAPMLSTTQNEEEEDNGIAAGAIEQIIPHCPAPILSFDEQRSTLKQFIQIPPQSSTFLAQSSSQHKLSQHSLTLSVPGETTTSDSAQQRRTSSTGSGHKNSSGGERRPSSRKSSGQSEARKLQQKQHRLSSDLKSTTAIGFFDRFRKRLSTLIQTGLGLDSRESITLATAQQVPSFMHNSHSFSSMSSISSSTQPGMFSKRTSVLFPPSHLGGAVQGGQQLQKPVPTLTITRDSLPQNVAAEAAQPFGAATIVADPLQLTDGDNTSTTRRSSGFLQALFAPISTFQRRRKKTKAERRAHKAFRTITFIVGLFAILWSPYYVVATVYGFCHGDCIPSLLYNVSYYMCYLNSSLNPFAYALANRQFRSAFLRILRGNFRQSR